MKYTNEQLEAIAAKLRDMPPIEKKKAGAQQTGSGKTAFKRDNCNAKAWIHS